MKKILIFFVFIPLFCVSQKQGNIWYFGDHAGIDFNSGFPIALNDGATYNDNYPHSEGTSIVCDSSGSILFYSNGQKIWNKNHNVMPNGDSLLGHLSSTQSSLIVPLPSSSRYFYVFTTDAFWENYLQYGFRYSIVDICLDNGLGDVVENQKNILLLDTVAEKLTAIRHSNGVDYWIMTHKFFSDAFYTYLLTNNGIIDTVISHVGSIHTEYCSVSTYPTRSAIGALKASPDGNKIACVNGQTCYNISELFDFDNTTGVVSNVINLEADSVSGYFYGISFSPDNSKLYITSSVNHERIYQFDLSSGNPTNIINSKTIIASQVMSPWYCGMQLGPDGKIYIAIRNQNALAVINNPNLSGTNCNFVDQAVSLNGNLCSYGLPNLINFFDYSNTVFNCSTGIEEDYYNKQVSISPNPFLSETTLLTNDDLRDGTITIYNSFGRQVKQIKNISGQKITLHQDNLSSGLYFLQLIQNNKVITVIKLVIAE